MVREGLASQVALEQRTNGRQMSPGGQTLPDRVTASAKAPLGKRGSYIPRIIRLVQLERVSEGKNGRKELTCF